ncbi:substrate-binding domain-containing protein [Streptomyces sp. NPDC047028]|uniref:substrate-binding domain-containing protein n=1 Tax=Streptomyces sp. NPDC047028 TaxID=3155793 RepID=UPI0033C1EA96
MRRIALPVAACTMALTLTGCAVFTARGTQQTSVKGDDITVGVLMPETANTRYSEFDYPIIKRKVTELTPKGKVDYANARSSAGLQARQMRKMIADRVDVIVLDAVDAHAIRVEVERAKEARIPVIAYDRLAEGPIDAYVSFDNALVGEVQGRTLLEALGPGADTSDKIVMMNGSPTDPNAAQFKRGALSELSGQVTVARSYDTKDWDPANAQANMAEAIKALGGNGISAVYSANDGMAGGIVKAFHAAGVTRLPPITGQDADLAAVQRIVTGEQYMSVYKPYADEAEAAAQLAVTKVQGRDIQFDALAEDKVDSPTTKDVPARLVQVTALTRSNIKSTVVADGVFTLSDICTAPYAAACAAIGLR